VTPRAGHRADAGAGAGRDADSSADADADAGSAARERTSGRAARPWRWLALALAAGAAAGLTGCWNRLPPLPERAPSTVLVAGADSALARVAADPAGSEGRSGTVPLREPVQALAARLWLVRTAERSLDVQVYIWHDDASGRLLLHELWRAAARGVRVRLLLDDNGIDGMDPWLQALASQRGVEVRLFNPFVQRNLKALGYLTDFARLNRRMHNKSFTADGLATIVGGRNVGDVYFGVDASLQFADLDLLALGPAARDTAQHFDGFWNSTLAYPLPVLLGPPDAALLQRHRAELADPSATREVAALRALLQKTPWLAAAPGSLQPPQPLQWVPVQVLSDPPAKPAGPPVSPAAGSGTADAGRTAGGAGITEPLLAALSAARVSLDLVSPYFVPGDAGVRRLADLARRGVTVRIVTNSLAATDVVAVHAGYARHRRELLAAGIEVHELKPDAAARAAAGSWLARLGLSSGASLHGKLFVVDGQRLFAGSFNLDPRSAYLNTEMGLLVDSEEMAGAMSAGIVRDLPSATYRLALADDGALRWLETGVDGQTVHTGEPRSGWLRRAGARVLSWLPIEGLL